MFNVRFLCACVAFCLPFVLANASQFSSGAVPPSVGEAEDQKEKTEIKVSMSLYKDSKANTTTNSTQLSGSSLEFNSASALDKKRVASESSDTLTPPSNNAATAATVADLTICCMQKLRLRVAQIKPTSSEVVAVTMAPDQAVAATKCLKEPKTSL